MTDSGGWAAFWGGNHSIYVNARHASVHYERLAADLTALVSARGTPVVLDWGCGDALNAPVVAKAACELLLYDAVAAVQDRIRARFANTPGIRVLDTPTWQSWPAASLDLIIVNSVAQYMSRADLDALLEDFHRVVKPGGEVVIADIIAPHTGFVADIVSLLSSAWTHGYFLAACWGLVATFFSDYRKLRGTAGFSVYEEGDFLDIFAAHGFRAERMARNVGFNQQRMAFRATPI